MSKDKAPWCFTLHGDERGIARKLADGIEARIFPGEQLMISVVRCEPHASGSVHGHPEEQWGVLLEGSCTRIQDGHEVEAVAGDFWYTPGGVPHGVRTGAEGCVILDIFSPPRAEYRQTGAGFGSAKLRSE
jgi:quercetin dioxygenase-like cupin family protein